MPDIMDYLDWRGDLSFHQASFNEVDNLILAQLSYIDFDHIVPSIDSKRSISLEEASKLFFAVHTEEELLTTKVFTRLAPMMMKKMATTNRFKNIRLAKYINHIDYTSQKQFSALHIILDKSTLYVAYRGTDDTLIGWKEDFNMSFMTPVPSQIEAVEYLNTTVGLLPRNIIIGGHSKGGNLAIYAGVNCKPRIKSRIVAIYNNDGPGFDSQLVSSSAYLEILNKITTIVPESSIVGILLEQKQPYTIIKSTQNSIMQHDAMSWQVHGNHFVYSDSLSKGSQILDDTLKSWLKTLSNEERKHFIDTLFELFESTGARTLSDLSVAKLAKISTALKTYNSMDETTKNMVGQIIKGLTSEYYKFLKQSLISKSENQKNTLT